MRFVHLLAESYIHTIDPTAIQLTDAFGIRWYGISYAIGFIVAWLVMWWLARTRRILLSPQQVGDYITYAIIGVLVGGRLGYCFFYDPSLLVEFSSSFPYWGVFAIHEGGMASHGGVIGMVVAMAILAARSGVPFLHLLDVTAFVAPPGLFFGRLANFVNGELWGVPLPASMQADPPWWSIKFPEEINYVSPENVQALAPLLVNPAVEDLPRQVVIEAYSGNEALLEELGSHLVARWPSQFFQAMSDGPILLLVLVLVWLVARKPGIVAGWFLVAYGTLRIITEFFREPDEGLSFILGMSRGQALSVLMILLGIGLIVWCAARNVDRVGGLLSETGTSHDEERPGSGVT